MKTENLSKTGINKKALKNGFPYQSSVLSVDLSR